MAVTPASLCLLRLSALGDVTHVVPLVRTLQAGFPETQLHWIIDRAGLKLLDGLPGVQFHAYDKRSGVAGMRALRRSLAPLGRFDALLQMQVALRANVLSAFVPARRRIG
ncbi:glycosyltransferase family 9 protein, partial [Xanthomonas citri]